MLQQPFKSLQEPGVSVHRAEKSNTRLSWLLSPIGKTISAMLLSVQTLTFLSFYYLTKDYLKLITRRFQARLVFWKCSRFFTLVIEATGSIDLEIHTVVHIYFFILLRAVLDRIQYIAEIPLRCVQIWESAAWLGWLSQTDTSCHVLLLGSQIFRIKMCQRGTERTGSSKWKAISVNHLILQKQFSYLFWFTWKGVSKILAVCLMSKMWACLKYLACNCEQVTGLSYQVVAQDSLAHLKDLINRTQLGKHKDKGQLGH